MRCLSMGYDQWKTASPYDDEIDFGEEGASCPECGGIVLEHFGDAPSLDSPTHVGCMLMCDECGCEFSFALPVDPGDVPEPEPLEGLE